MTESAWARLRAWHLRAPAERLPLPVALLTWPAAWVLHAAYVPGHVLTYATVAAAVACWLTWHRYGRTSPHQRMLPTEAGLVAAAIGAWVAAAVTWGPLAGPRTCSPGSTWEVPRAGTGGCAVTRPSRLPASAATMPSPGRRGKPNGTGSRT